MLRAFLICAFAAPLVCGQILPDAVKMFPGQTSALEYDNLRLLRRLPNYRALRQQYSGEELAKAQKAMAGLGISEDQLNEVVTAAGPEGFFGLMAGSFRFAGIERAAAGNGFARTVMGGEIAFCNSQRQCFEFSGKDDGRAIFGSPELLRTIELVRLGRNASLASNTRLKDLLDRRDPDAPVIGVAPGREVGQWVSEGISKDLSSKLNLPELFSGIEVFGYSVRMDNKAHVLVNLLCSSELAGTALRNALSTAGSLEHMAQLAVGDSSMPFENLAVNSSGRLVAMTLDAPVPSR